VRFVDIKGGRVLSCDASGGDRQEIDTGGNPSFVVKARDGRLLTGTGDQLRVVTGTGLGDVVATIPSPRTTAPTMPRSTAPGGCGSRPWTTRSPRARAPCGR